MVSSDYSFDGSKSIVAAQKAEAFGVVKAEGMKYVRLAARMLMTIRVMVHSISIIL